MRPLVYWHVDLARRDIAHSHYNRFQCVFPVDFVYAVFLWVYPVTALWENRERGQSDAFYRNSFEMTVKKCYLPTSDVTAVSYSSLRRFFFFLFVLWETCLCRSTDLLEARVGTSQGPLHANWSALRRDSLKISSRKHTRMLSLCLSNGSPSIISGL